MSERYIGGIPEKTFNVLGRGDVVGRSGKKIRYQNYDNRIEVNQGNFNCLAFTETIGGVSYFRLALKTKTIAGQKESRPPDLYSHQFAIKAHQEFLSRGIKLAGFKAVWQADSDNYASFIEALKRGDTKTAAASQTWSGKLARDLGYSTQITVYYYHKRELVEVFFT